MKKGSLKTKRVISLVLAAVITAGSLAGCGEKNESETKSATAKDAKYVTTYGDKKFNNVTIKVELFDRSNAPEGNTLTDNKWVKYVNEEMSKVGINVEYRCAQSR